MKRVVAIVMLICMSAVKANRVLTPEEDMATKLKQDRLRIIADQHKLINAEETYENDLENELGEPHVESLDKEEKPSKSKEESAPAEGAEEEQQQQVEEQQQQVEELPSKVEGEDVAPKDESVEESSGSVDQETLKSALKTYYEELTAADDVEGEFSAKESIDNMDAIINKYGTSNEGIEQLKTDLTSKYGGSHSLNIGDSAPTFRFKSRRAKTEMSSTKKLLHRYYEKINPSKLKDIDLIVSKVDGNIEHLSSLLKTKYGVALNEIDNVNEQEDSASSMLEEKVSMEVFSKDEVKNKLLQLYAVNEPSKLPYIDALMEMYDGREGELLHAAEKKYSGQ